MEELAKKAAEDSQKRRGAGGGAASAWGTTTTYDAELEPRYASKTLFVYVGWKV
jgi:hypothetical protein